MIDIAENIELSKTITAELFVHRTTDGRYIISIPKIHWSAQINAEEEYDTHFKHIQSSLNFQLFDGDTDNAVHLILKTVEQLRLPDGQRVIKLAENNR
ncbi:YueH family protein [Metabacillus sp. RGM 3146]|uniref:YueH family protein n=1 Tax=Metabacillus sp. RGM 3146 TaxID=3401092 RepID=UPI003B9A1417